MRRSIALAAEMTLAGGLLSMLPSCGTLADAADIHAVMTTWHEAAATGDLDAYTSRMTDDVVFLGTDKTERWVGEEFIAFCEPYFDGPKPYGEGAWTYEPIERHVAFDTANRTAWVDEWLHNASYGNCRGTGVLVREGGGWKIAHYSLTFLVPNAVAKDLVAQAQAHERSIGEAAPTPMRRYDSTYEDGSR